MISPLLLKFGLAICTCANVSLAKFQVKRLGGKTQLSVRVYLDAGLFGGTVPRFQRARVRERLNAGA